MVNVLCFGGSTGAATVIASGGTTPYTYSWSTSATASVVTTLNNGVRSVTVTDASGCTSNNSVTISQPLAALSTATAALNLLCNGATTGSASISVSGGTSPYTYLWSNAATTSVITGLNAGIRTVTITDANACTINNTITITQPASLTLTLSASSTSICSNNSTTLTANAGGGTGVITYTWVAGPSSSSNVVSPVVNTTYSVNISDANACTFSSNITVTVAPSPTLTVNNGTICNSFSFTLTPSGASTYTYSGGSAIVSPSTTTSFSITGTSSLGCVSSNTAVALISVNALPIVSASTSNSVICLNATTAVSGSGANTYTWTASSGTVSTGISFSPNVTASYSVSGSNTLTGCTSTNAAAVTITVNPLPVLTITSSNSVSTSGQTITLSASGANSYTWSNTISGTSIAVNPISNTIYSLVAIDLNGCKSSKNFTQQVSSLQPGLSATIKITTVTCKGKNNGSIQIEPVINYNNYSVQSIWGSTVSCRNAFCNRIDSLVAGIYPLSLIFTYTTPTNYVRVDTLVLPPIEVTESSESCELIPFSGITPNGDGINEGWQITNIDNPNYRNNKVTIFNRWGAVVAEIKGYDNVEQVWPKKVDIDKLPASTYYYIIDLGDGSPLIKGWIELIKN